VVEAEHRQHAVVELTIRDLRDQALQHFPFWPLQRPQRCLDGDRVPGAQPAALDDPDRTAGRDGSCQTSGRLTRSARQWTLHLPARRPWQGDLIRALARIRVLPAPGRGNQATLTTTGRTDYTGAPAAARRRGTQLCRGALDAREDAGCRSDRRAQVATIPPLIRQSIGGSKVSAGSRRDATVAEHSTPTGHVSSRSSGSVTSTAPKPSSGRSMKKISIVISGSTWAWLRNARTSRPVSSSIFCL
jgi:hypothetical protein